MITLLASLLVLLPGAPGPQGQAAPQPLSSRWAAEVDPRQPWPTYPRPALRRSWWQNLNGSWQYAIRPHQEDRPAEFDGEILVPFPVESALSGVGRRVGDLQCLWYRRTFRLAPGPVEGGVAAPLPERPRWLLHFGAVDWQADVWVNGRMVGSHSGGYDPFWFDVSAEIGEREEHEVVVRVWDPTDRGTQPRGKQVEQPNGIWYTPVTGIWQTVWLEAVPRTWLRAVRVTPDAGDRRVRVLAEPAGDPGEMEVAVRVFAGPQESAELVSTGRAPQGVELLLPLPGARLWSPEQPFRYRMEVSLQERDRVVDQVVTDFGVRKVEVKKDQHGVNRIFLNDQPLFQYGPLDQGWWPDGLYTAPNLEALRFDLEQTKELGFNLIRKHVKVEPALWYWECDRLGLLVWQDMPSGDRSADWRPGVRDARQEIQRDEGSAAQYRRELKAMVDFLDPHACVVMWVPFNEAWGQFDTEAISAWLRSYDPTRLVNCASGGNDFPAGQVRDVHSYPGPACPPLEEQRAAVLGEFGGLGLRVAAHSWRAAEDRAWSYRGFDSGAELTQAYLDLVARLRPLVDEGLAAAVYTQTSDVEFEVNGLLTYDRALLKMDAERLKAAHRLLYEPPRLPVTLLADARAAAQEWRFATTAPPAGWERPEFDDSAWPAGAAGFGRAGTPGAVVRSEWTGDELWIRRGFELDPTPCQSLHLRVHHDEDAEIWLNGGLIAELNGYTTDYVLIPIPAAAALLRPGRNVLAAHCRQTAGGQYLDLGLVDLRPAAESR